MDPRAYAIHKRLIEKTGRRFEPPSSKTNEESKPLTVPLIRPPDNCENHRRQVFPYDPLPTPTSIRLLRLHLEKHENEFDIYITPRCTLVVVDLDDAPRYDALSYTWGCPVTMYPNAKEVSPEKAWATPAFDIICNETPVSVTANLYAALLSLRLRASKDAERSFQKASQEGNSDTTGLALQIWIDQVCINQSDLNERSTQVTLMRRIYKQARVCSVWLGGDDAFSPAGLETMRKLGDVTTGMHPKPRWTKIFEIETYERLGIEPIGPWEWISFDAFLSRSWFWRSWVVQEAALSQSVSFCCGISTFPLGLMIRALNSLMGTDWAISVIKLVETLQGTSDTCMRQAEQVKARAPGTFLYQLDPEGGPNPFILRELAVLRAGGRKVNTSNCHTKGACDLGGLSLSQVMLMFRNLRASDPRDKVYAFLALAEELGQVQTVIPDYRKPVTEVFRDAMQFAIQSSNSLNDLSQKEDPIRTRLPKLQSWIPDFSIDDRTSQRTNAGLKLCSAGSCLGRTHIMFRPGGALEVRGLCIGTVCAVNDLDRLGNLGVGDGQRSFLNFVQFLPEYSRVWVPPITPSLRLLLDTSGLVPNRNIYHQVLFEKEGTVARQSRLEVLWRTLLANRFGNEFPPSKSTVDLFLRFWTRSLKLRIVAAVTLFGPGLPVCRVRSLFNQFGGYSKTWDGVRSSISNTYHAQTFLTGQKSDETQNDSFFEEVAAILPELDSAKAIGRMSAKGQAIVQRITKTIPRSPSAEEIGWEKRAMVASWGKRLFVTNEGQLGAGPESTGEGDEVWILAGADMPFVLRQREEGRHSLIGEAYVHGAMFARPDSDLSTKDIKTVLIV